MKQEEGNFADMIQEQASKVPGNLYLWTGLGLLGASLLFRMANKKKISRVLGQLSGSIIVMGLYNKTVKQQGHDSTSSQWNTPTEARTESVYAANI